MKMIRVLSVLAGVSLVAACAAPPKLAEKIVPPSLEAMLAQADLALKSGQSEKAIADLRAAAAAYPKDKAPWLSMAQLRFDHGYYGEAILNAQESLQRDPDDKLAHSIIAVSGLRVSSIALTDLSTKNNLSGSVRAEAQELAKLLRTSLGEEVLVPAAPAQAKLQPRPPAIKPVKPAISAKNANDPFGALK